MWCQGHKTKSIIDQGQTIYNEIIRYHQSNFHNFQWCNTFFAFLFPDLLKRRIFFEFVKTWQITCFGVLPWSHLPVLFVMHKNINIIKLFFSHLLGQRIKSFYFQIWIQSRQYFKTFLLLATTCENSIKGGSKKIGIT